MADPNTETLAAYEKGWRRYVEAWERHLEAEPGMALDYHGPWLPDALALRPPGSTVLEIGSGTGYDADLMEQAAVQVERTDATAAFTAYLHSRGHLARQLNILTGEPGSGYGMVYAFAVFQHFPYAALQAALRKCAGALMPGGVLAFSVRRGEHDWCSECWQERKGMAPRYFMFWPPGSLWATVEDAGLRMVSMHYDARANSGELKKWLLVTAVRDAG